MFGLVPFAVLPKPIRVILVANIAVFLVAWLGNILGEPIIHYVILYGSLIPTRYTDLWRFVSYAFIHVNFWHAIFNMLMLWMFSMEVYKSLGHKMFLWLYFFAAIVAGLVSVLFYQIGVTGNNPIIGASGALFGIMVAYSVLFPEQMILLFFILPMKIKYAVWIFIAVDLFMANSGDGIAHFAHLGGALAGYIFMFTRSKNFFENKSKQYSREYFREKAENYSKSKPALQGEVHQGNASKQNENKLNSILEKINKSGLQSLSEDEKTFLQWYGQNSKRRL